MSKSFEILGQELILVCPSDWNKSMGFWRDALGMEVAADWSDDDHGAAALKFGDSHIVVAGHEEARDKEVGFSVEPGQTYLYVKVKGLDALVAHLKSQNIEILGGPVKTHWGPRIASAKDPDGVPVLFVEGDSDPALVAQFVRKGASTPLAGG